MGSHMDRFVPVSTHGNRTSIDLDVPPAAAWDALASIRLTDLRISRLLLAVRWIPGRLRRRGAFGTEDRDDPADQPPLVQMLGS